MEIADIIPHVEALIFASDHPLPAIEILDLLNQSQGFLEDQVNINQVTTALEAVAEKYHSAFYAFEVVESGGGFQFLTKPQYHATVARLNGDKYLKRLSKASLETLAIIAYKQPVTKSDIESIRGVNSDYSVQKLLEKELIAIKGRREDAPGKPLLYVTSASFMDYFGLNTPDELPRIKEVKEEITTQPTLPPVNPLPDEKLAEKLKDAEVVFLKTDADQEGKPESNGNDKSHPVQFAVPPEEASSATPEAFEAPDENTGTSDNDVETSENSAEMPGDNAGTSDDDVETSENSAEMPGDNAGTSDDDVETSENSAEAPDENTGTSDDDVETSENSAETPDDNAGTPDDDNAGTPDNDVETSENSAETPDDNAGTPDDGEEDIEHDQKTGD